MSKREFNQVPFHYSPVVPQVADTDYGGGVYHGKYIALYNQARDMFLEELGMPYRHLMDRGMNLTVAQLTCRYLKPVSYGRTLMVGTKVVWYGTKSICMLHEIRLEQADGEPDPAVRNEMEIVLVATSKNRKSIPLPSGLIDAVERYYA